MSKSTLVWTDIPVTDLKRAVDFYSKVLATPISAEETEEMGFALLPLAGEAPSGCLVVAEDNKPCQSGPLIYLNVTGRLDEAARIVGDSSGKILAPPHQIGPYGFRAIIVDSEGNRIALHSETA